MARALSDEQRSILATAMDTGEFAASTVADRNRIVRLHGLGLVRRHPTDLDRCEITLAGTRPPGSEA